MKKTFLLVSFLAASILAVVSYSCSEQLQDAEALFCGECSEFTLAEVQRAFESDWARVPGTRADAAFDEDRILAPGRIVPAWDAIAFCYGGSDTSVIRAEVPFEAQYEYRLLRWTEEGDPSFSSMPSRLVVLKDPETGATASWLFFLIPETGGWLSDDPADFSGVALYATLSGVPVCAGRYDGGVLAVSASLLDESRSWEENAGRLAELLPENIYVARIQPKIATRRSDIAWSIDIEEVTVVAEKPIKSPEPSEEVIVPERGPIPVVENVYYLPLFGSGSGGGGGGFNSNTSKVYSKNPKIKVEKEIEKDLDSLYKDCMGKRLINSINATVSIESVWGRYGCCTNVSSTSYTIDGKTSVIWNFEIEMGASASPVTLMEELTHVYQTLNGNYKNAELNKEVEAKLAWYTYLKRIGSNVDKRRALGGNDGVKYFENMRKHVINNDLKNPMFSDAFTNAAEALRQHIKAYGNQERYKFDPNRINCSNLMELLKDCESK